MPGHRLLLVHLFLPDTLAFKDWPQESQNTHYRVPSQQAGSQLQIPITTIDAPPSPPSAESTTNPVSAHELEKRLARASLVKKNGAASQDRDDADDDAALSDTDSPVRLSEIQPRTRSARSSFNEHSRKVNMSLLMSEAAHGGGSSGVGSGSGTSSRLSKSSSDSSFADPRSARSSPSGGNKAMILPDLLRADPERLPVAAASDHGRSANSSLSPSRSTFAMQNQTTSLSPSSGPSPVGRRGSTGASASKAFLNPLALSMSSAHSPNDSPNDGSGTRAPGARVSGKAGTMTPISIIGDLAVSLESRIRDGSYCSRLTSPIFRQSNHLYNHGSYPLQAI
jgi:hypothetical protein